MPSRQLARPVSRRTFTSLAGSRPMITYGVQSGDVVADRAVIWSRTDRPARMWVELSKTDSFRHADVVRGRSPRPPPTSRRRCG
ncbi:MAG: PhoD-like phosphatase N-terminal domain-containing protein [Acidimicrobiales bacterium]